MGASVTGPDGQQVLLHGGSYGIGPTRLVPAIIEASHDENGIIWPDSVAPFDAVVINMKAGDAACDTASEGIYAALTKAGFDVIYEAPAPVKPDPYLVWQEVRVEARVPRRPASLRLVARS